MSDRLLKLAEVSKMIGCGHTFIYERVGLGEFPAPLRLSSRCVR